MHTSEFKIQKVQNIFWQLWFENFKRVKRHKNEESFLKCLDFQDEKIELVWEYIFSACRSEVFSELVSFRTAFLCLSLWTFTCWFEFFGAYSFENGFMDATMGLIVLTYWISISYNKRVSQIITGRPLRGHRLAARFSYRQMVNVIF